MSRKHEFGHCKLPEDQGWVFVSQHNGKDLKLQPKLPFPARQENLQKKSSEI